MSATSKTPTRTGPTRAARKLQATPLERRRPRKRKVRREGPPTAYYMIATMVMMLTLLGVVMVLSSSSVTSLHQGASPWRYFTKQAMWAVLGAFALVTVMRVPYQRLRRFTLPIIAIAHVLMTLPFIPSIGKDLNGARAWVEIGPISFQPSEIMKVAVLLYCADVLTNRENRMHIVRDTLWPCLVVLGTSASLTIIQGDLGSAIVLASIVLIIAFVAGAPMTPMFTVTSGAGVLGLIFVFSSDYRRQRWTAFLDLAAHKSTSGFQVWQSLIGIADGGISGVGIGESKAKWGYLPLAHSDFIFAIVAEELGFIGVVAVIGAFILFVACGLSVALNAKDRFGMLIAAGVTAWVSIQALINLGGVTGLMPLTGLTLPFVSFGGSSLISTMIATGLLLSVARTANGEKQVSAARSGAKPRRESAGRPA